MTDVLCPRLLYLLVFPMLIFGGTTLGQNLDSTVRTKLMDISVTKVPVNVAVKEIERQSGIPFSGEFDPNCTVTLAFHQVPVITVLQALGDSIGFMWQTAGNKIRFSMDPNFRKVESVIKVGSTSTATTKIRQISGTILDMNGGPLSKATVQVVGKRNGVKTDNLGRFSLQTPNTKEWLAVSYLGYENQNVSVFADKPVEIRLNTAVGGLNEHVVMTYDVAPKWKSPGNSVKITLDDKSKPLNSNGLLALQGRAAGMNLTQSTGIPGGTVDIQVRGLTSFSGSTNPQFVVAGVPVIFTHQSVSDLSSIASQSAAGGLGSFNSMSFDGIESMSLLKDADATAIYGSRGAGGIVLLTPFRPQPGPLKIDMTLLKGIGQPAHHLDMLSTRQYLLIRKEALKNDKLQAGSQLEQPGFAPDVLVWDSLKNTNWEKKLLSKTADITNGSVTLSGGNSVMQARMTASYYRQGAVLSDKLYYDRYSIGGSFVYERPRRRFRLDIFTSMSKDKNRLIAGSLDPVSTPPNAPDALDQYGNLVWTRGIENPFAQLLRKYNMGMYNHIVSIIPKIKIANGLHLKAILGSSSLKTKEDSRMPLASFSPLSLASSIAQYSQASKRLTSYITEPILEFAPDYIPGELTIIVGASLQHTSKSGNIKIGSGYKDDRFLEQWDSAADIRITPLLSSYKYGAVFGLLKYIWKNKYIGSLGFRTDGSSKFSPEKRTGRFWSVAAAWIFSEEDFLKHSTSVLSFGKIRVSAGQTGSDNVGDNGFQDVWSPTPNKNLYEGIGGLRQENTRNKDFTWERTSKLEAAVYLELWDRRIRTDLAYFRNRTYNQLTEYPMAAQSGYQKMLRNTSAQVLNAGLELTLEADVVRWQAGSFSLTTNLNYLSNRLISYNRLDQSPYYGKLVINEPIMVVNKLKSEGVDPETGRYRFLDVNGDGELNEKDYQVIGSSIPKFFGGVGIQLKHNRLEVKAHFDFRTQIGPTYLYTALLADRYPGSLFNQPSEVLNRWQKKGDNAQYQRFSTRADGPEWAAKPQIIFSSEAYGPSGFIKLRTLYIGYNFPNRWLKRLYCEEVKLFLKAENLWTLTNYKTGDPETANIRSLSTLKMMAAGIRFTPRIKTKKSN